MTGLTANRELADDFEDDLSPAKAAALFAGRASKQQQMLTQLRANALEEVKANFGRQAAEWQERAYNRLDNAFRAGFYRPRPNSTATANAQTLDFEEWEGRDEDNLQEIRYSLTIADQIISAGFDVNTSLARTVYTRQRESAWQTSGNRSMDGRAKSRDDEAVLEIFGSPIPIAHVDYEISTRKQQQSQNFGEDVETRKARQAGRILREVEEGQMLNGWSQTVTDSEGNTLTMYGLTDSSVTITGSADGDWGTASNIHSTARSMLNDLESQTSNNDRGPDPVETGAWLWYHPNQRSDLRAPDPEGDGNQSVMSRLQQDFPYLEMSAAGELSDGELVMAVQDPRFVEVLNAQGPTNLSEEVEMGLATEYKALSARVPFIKKTYDGIKGTVYYTGA
jgi:Tfp pilus assembly protein PilV